MYHRFGEPFATAFSRLYHGEREEIAAAAYTCSLFLSAMFEEYPTAKLAVLTEGQLIAKAEPKKKGHVSIERRPFLFCFLKYDTSSFFDLHFVSIYAIIEKI